MQKREMEYAPDAVLATLRELPDGSLVTKTGCLVHVPESYRQKQLLSMGEEILMIGYFTIIVGKQYASWQVPAMIRTQPTDMRLVEVEGRSYYEFEYAVGGSVAKSLDLVVDNLNVYPLFEDTIARARTPWFYSYTQMATFFRYAPQYANVNLVPTPSVFEMFIAQQARVNSNRTEPVRRAIKNQKELAQVAPFYIPMRNVEYGATDTTSKLAGSYTAEGLDSALVNPNDKTQPVENILRL